MNSPSAAMNSASSDDFQHLSAHIRPKQQGPERVLVIEKKFCRIYEKGYEYQDET